MCHYMELAQAACVVHRLAQAACVVHRLAQAASYSSAVHRLPRLLAIVVQYID